MKILVSGGRNFENILFFNDVLFHVNDNINKITKVIHGSAKGVDSLASEYAKEYDIEEKGYKPDWNLGKSAGMQRNKDMVRLEKPKLVICFPTGGPGTQHMIDHLDKRSKYNRIELDKFSKEKLVVFERINE